MAGCTAKIPGPVWRPYARSEEPWIATLSCPPTSSTCTQEVCCFNPQFLLQHKRNFALLWDAAYPSADQRKWNSDKRHFRTARAAGRPAHKLLACCRAFVGSVAISQTSLPATRPRPHFLGYKGCLRFSREQLFGAGGAFRTGFVGHSLVPVETAAYVLSLCSIVVLHFFVTEKLPCGLPQVSPNAGSHVVIIIFSIYSWSYGVSLWS